MLVYENMADILDRCITKLLSDPNFKPKRDRESSAYAICYGSLKKAHKMSAASAKGNPAIRSEVEKQFDELSSKTILTLFTL
jgi:hypothetical protein